MTAQLECFVISVSLAVILVKRSSLHVGVYIIVTSLITHILPTDLVASISYLRCNCCGLFDAIKVIRASFITEAKKAIVILECAYDIYRRHVVYCTVAVSHRENVMTLDCVPVPSPN